ncbi:alpha/beta fold hydrolase [Streptomyces viridochromogenes]|uniref:Putative Alpha/beta hydrolase fold protein n=1 Tax=Streptomyces viridochromogenes Tue57 TaxID=1160705 RepID=L8PR15_STRVR|nr:alpha/beta hydrolase [Streptomyces viridochromogenes]ELS58529.1 putative Alpha/beta hydrolase fold protein [Streptomyces viridochromogenes Tue57]
MAEISYGTADDCTLHTTVIGAGKALVLMHAGGPDHKSMLPLAERLADRYMVILPDLRGYGRSVCRDPARYTWAQYTEDVIWLLDHMGVPNAVLAGAGLGSTITLRTAAAHPDRVEAAVLIGVEDIEDDEAKDAEIRFLDAFASRVAADGIEAGWEPILSDFPPVVGAMVRDAIPRSDPASIVAAAAIGHDRSFRSVSELARITTPTLVFPGTDPRHPTALAEEAASTLPNGQLAMVSIGNDLQTAEDLACAIAPAIREFLRSPVRAGSRPSEWPGPRPARGDR